MAKSKADAVDRRRFLKGAAVSAAARTRLSFSRWTLSHEIARLVLAEQLYRAGTIVRGEPYHK